MSAHMLALFRRPASMNTPAFPADEFGAVVHPVSAASVFGAYLGESERRLREAFEAAARDAAAGKLAVLFLDEVSIGH
jgi:AAA+ superfamily predicted ATPase